MEVRSNATAIASTLTNIRDQTAITMQTVTQHLDDMEETIRDTFVDLKVKVLASTLASLERNIATRFTTVNTALAQMASPTHTAGGSNGPSAAGGANGSGQSSSPNQRGQGDSWVGKFNEQG